MLYPLIFVVFVNTQFRLGRQIISHYKTIQKLK